MRPHLEQEPVPEILSTTSSTLGASEVCLRRTSSVQHLRLEKRLWKDLKTAPAQQYPAARDQPKPLNQGNMSNPYL